MKTKLTEIQQTSLIGSQPNDIQYVIRSSARAKHLQLRISERRGLEVVVPKRLMQTADINGLIDKKRDWITRHLNVLESKTEILATPILPHEINLNSLQENWQIRYVENSRWELLENSFKQLTLLGNLQNTNRCKKLLIQWIKNKAEIYLGQLLHDLSREHKLVYRHLQIRGQQTRWGSCTSQGDISLNYQLLFLPFHLVRHILLHELVHTVHMNHGVRFWRLLMKLDSQTKTHAYEARRARVYVPKWIVLL